jgi:ABC-type branched-subunit amino acid transport system ATPase component
MTLEADTIWLEYNGRKILHDIYVKIETGQAVGLLGRNGTGKTCLMQAIFGTLRSQSQSVRVEGRYLKAPYQQKNLIRYLPQKPFTPNLKLGIICDAYEVDFIAICHDFPEFEKYDAAYTDTLSGGLRRLFDTLLILLSPVTFVLLDEPFAHLSPLVVEKLMRIINEQKKNKGIMISDHDYRNVLKVSDVVYLIVPGGRSVLMAEPETDLKKFGYLR